MPLSSDIVLTLFLPLILGLLAYHVSSLFTWAELASLLSLKRPLSRVGQYDGYSLPNAYKSYLTYRQLSSSQVRGMQRAYATISRRHKRIGYDIGYPAKLRRLEETNEANGAVTDRIAQLAKEELGHELGSGTEALSINPSVARVREALKHFVRDWSSEGAEERERIFRPILDILQQAPKKAGSRILLPGSGLGRLAYEIAQLDSSFDVTANELSFYMNLAFRFLCSPKTTTEVDQHVVHPYAYWFSHQRRNGSLFRPVKFPDVVPRFGDNFRLVEQDFLTLQGEYDYIVTLFFIDTSTNILATLDQIHTLLKPGGIWINLGPLLWCSGSQAKMELSLEEVWEAARAVGFTIEEDSARTVPCEYTHDGQAMMKWIYQAEFWVARRGS
ncbi:hypothetical protein AAF712_008959 [Marasmius tenuissimus]|uniref:N2227-domain-containing protein n=1 Tax=Marasmius tenuissimus TaxID=585030 RepID=A0ABR2ZSF6_9AGAR